MNLIDHPITADVRDAGDGLAGLRRDLRRRRFLLACAAGSIALGIFPVLLGFDRLTVWSYRLMIATWVLSPIFLYFAQSGPPSIRILWLRRFHAEQAPAFRLSHSMRYLASLGARVITLRDTRVRGNADRFTGPFLVAILTLSIASAAIFLAGSDALYTVIPWVFLGFAVVVVGFPLWIVLGRVWARAPKRNDPTETRRFAQQLMRKSHRELVVVETDDAAWQATVSALVEVADYVLVDLGNPSENILWELSAIEDLRRFDKTLLLHPEGWSADQQSELAKWADQLKVCLAVSYCPVRDVRPSKPEHSLPFADPVAFRPKEPERAVTREILAAISTLGGRSALSIGDHLSQET